MHGNMNAVFLSNIVKMKKVFLQWIVTDDEIWKCHYEYVSKCQTMEWKHTSSPRIRKLKDGAFCWQSDVNAVLGLQWTHHGDISLGAFAASELDVVFSGYQPR
jgi:hypothetical protein